MTRFLVDGNEVVDTLNAPRYPMVDNWDAKDVAEGFERNTINPDDFARKY